METVQSRLVPAIRMPHRVGGAELQVSCSVGVAIYPDDASDIDELMRHADVAMYQAKQLGRDAAHLFTSELADRAQRKQQLQSQLRYALERGELALAYQPKMKASDRSLVGVEALLRWTSPELGEVPPIDFIPIAEETRLVMPIGAWVVDEALRQHAQWKADGHGDIPVSINVSAVQLRNGDLAATVRDALRMHGVSAGAVEIELTESTLMDGLDGTQGQLRALRALGISVSVDDFGTGYSSLTYLNRFPIDRIKIDRSFIRNLLVDPGRHGDHARDHRARPHARADRDRRRGRDRRGRRRARRRAVRRASGLSLREAAAGAGLRRVAVAAPARGRYATPAPGGVRRRLDLTRAGRWRGGVRLFADSTSRPRKMTAFGHDWLSEFPLAPGAIYLNHGTVGVTPLAVMRARAAILEEIERHPARFMLRELMRFDTSTAWTSATPPRLREAAAAVATFLGASADGLAFVDNATSGICAVLRSLDLRAGDEVLLHDHAYGGIVRAAGHIAHDRGASITTFAMPFPTDSPDRMVDALDAAITPNTRVAVLDHVTSETALVLPLAAMARRCRERGVAVLVDGAHAPGAIDIDLESLAVDWYVGNLHKWAFAPRACGVLWAAPERRTGLHPAVISWGLTSNDWLAEFDWTGTRDPSPWLAAPAAIAFMRNRLGIDAMRTYNHGLVWDATAGLSHRWNLRVHDARVDDRLHGRDPVAVDSRRSRIGRRSARARSPAVRPRHRSAGLRAQRVAVGANLGAGLQRGLGHRPLRRCDRRDRARPDQSRISRPVSLRNTSSRFAGRCR